jgi:predicted TIM-barrel fold metal-dependent hydrolase
LCDWSTREVLKCAEKNPGKIVPFATLHPSQENKLALLQEYVSLGIQGLKLYTGHGEFYERPLNDPGMMEIYAYCELIGLPLCWHVNFEKYGDEFVEIMKQFPNLKVIVPHFGLGFYNINGNAMALMTQLMDQYPTVYTDSSFGTRAFLVNGLEEVHVNHQQFRDLFIKYEDRIVWGTDMVVTGNKDKTADWIESVIRACRDMMEKETYFTWMAAEGAPYAEAGTGHAYGQLRGMNLPEATLHKIYEQNLDKLLLKK